MLVQLVQQWLSTRKWSKNPVLFFNKSGCLSWSSGSNASNGLAIETGSKTSRQRERKPASLSHVLYIGRQPKVWSRLEVDLPISEIHGRSGASHLNSLRKSLTGVHNRLGFTYPRCSQVGNLEEQSHLTYLTSWV